MLGHSHALAGGVTGAAASEFVLHSGVIGTLDLAAFTACFATLCDLDTCGSCAARSLGFFSEGFAWLVSRVSGGHRHATHSVLGVAVFTAAASLACLFRHAPAGRWVLAVFLALAFAAGLRAFRLHGHLADLAGMAAAIGVAVPGYGVALIPLACGLGCATHIAGDMCTKSGCPLAWPFTMHEFRWWRPPLAFVTGTRPETLIVDPVLTVAAVALGLWAVAPALDLLAWHAATGWMS
jgi:membrane-bound metal-dependent hydrolase YbcI (DUF457 family)